MCMFCTVQLVCSCYKCCLLLLQMCGCYYLKDLNDATLIASYKHNFDLCLLGYYVKNIHQVIKKSATYFGK